MVNIVAAPNENSANHEEPAHAGANETASVTPATFQQIPQAQSGDQPNQDGQATASASELRFLDCLIDDVIFCECLQVHRAAKMGLIFTEPGDEMYSIKDGVGIDIFGQQLTKKKQLNCTCPQCGRNIAASRLAPHLEKCMGMGRLSARAAINKMTQ